MSEQGIDDILLDEATEWFVLMRADDISDQRATEFAQWISQSDQHQQAYLEIGGFWDDLSVVDQNSKTQDQQPEALATVTDLAAHRTQKSNQLNDLNHKKKLSWSPRLIAASVTLLLVSIVGVRYSDSLLMDHHVTEIGELADVILEDGSHLALNTNSEVRIDLQGDKRVVYLERGEVFFEVSKDKSRPFYVETQGGLVRVLGTKFNIRQMGQKSDVTVVEGSVGVMDYGRIADNPSTLSLDATLAADQRFILGDDDIENTASEVNSEVTMAWRDRKLIYNGENFAALIADLNRYYETEIRIGDPALNDIEVVAVLKVEDQATTLKALETTFNVTARPISKGLITLYPNP